MTYDSLLNVLNIGFYNMCWYHSIINWSIRAFLTLLILYYPLRLKEILIEILIERDIEATNYCDITGSPTRYILFVNLSLLIFISLSQNLIITTHLTTEKEPHLKSPRSPYIGVYSCTPKKKHIALYWTLSHLSFHIHIILCFSMSATLSHPI